MKKSIFYVMLLLPILSFSQGYFSISGNIKDKNGEPLELVNVVLTKTNKYDLTDANGLFEIDNIEKGEYILSISTLGFTTITKSITVDKDLNLSFLLKEDTETLSGISIESKKASAIQKEKAITVGSFELSDVISSTNVITDQIDKVSGVRIRRSGSLGGNSDISINGLSGSAVRTYIDGIPLEFLYPSLDIANVPLASIKRVDVYKGVTPVNIGTDALGGAINIITSNKKTNHLKASYSAGSFNTHLGDVNLTLVDDNDNFINFTGGINYSDNNYSFKATVLVNNPFLGPDAPAFEVPDKQNIERFNDQYRLIHNSTTLGTSNKKWTDQAQLTFTYLDGFQEIQNGVRISNIAIGEAYGESENFSTVLKYDKTLLKDKIKLKTITNYSNEQAKRVDTTSNDYNWLGNIFRVGNPGELSDGDPSLIESETYNYINRTTINYNINDSNKLVLSNIITHQERDFIELDIENDIFEKIPTQKVTKDNLGLEYQTKLFNDKLSLTGSGKYYNFKLSAFDERSDGIVELKDDFFGGYGSIKYKITPELAVRASYERGFLIPELTQFTGNPSDNIRGNSTIKPEESDNYNIGFLYSNKFNTDYSIFFSANAFLREQKNIVFLNVSRDPGQFVNAEESETKGVEAEFKFKFLKNFNWETNISYLEKTFAAFEDSQDANFVGTDVPNTPGFFYNTQLQWSKDNLFNTKVDVSLYGAYAFIDDFNFRIVGAEDTIDNSDAFIDDNNRIDTGISLQFLDKKITTAFNIKNITNEELFDNFSIPIPGRNFNFKLIYELSNF